MKDNNEVCGHEEDGNPIMNLGECVVREAGCGIFYRINFETIDEQQWEVELNREELEKLYLGVAKLLGKVNTPPALPTPSPWNTLPPVLPPWVNGSQWRIPPHGAF